MNEQKSLRIMEDIFQNRYKFEKAYPIWLKNAHGTQLELDGYNEKLGIAIEYNGPYHYDQKYYGTYEKFQIKKASDKIKEELCAANNVFLIVIPYTTKSIYDYVLSRLYDKGYNRKYKLPDDYIYLDYVNYQQMYDKVLSKNNVGVKGAHENYVKMNFLYDCFAI